MHIYLNGDICLPLVNPLYWLASTTIFHIGKGIIDMLHGTPNPKDPATYDMRDLFEKNPEEYFDFLRKQAKEFAKYK